MFEQCLNKNVVTLFLILFKYWNITLNIIIYHLVIIREHVYLALWESKSYIRPRPMSCEQRVSNDQWSSLYSMSHPHRNLARLNIILLRFGKSVISYCWTNGHNYRRPPSKSRLIAIFHLDTYVLVALSDASASHDRGDHKEYHTSGGFPTINDYVVSGSLTCSFFRICFW